MTDPLPPRPDFETMEAAAPASAERRTYILALIGNLVFSWSNNESLFIYVMMLMLRTDQTAAALVFTTLNTTRARLDLVQRLAKATISDRALLRSLNRLIDRFNDCTRVRNEFNHCMYTVNERGEITHTHSMRIQETRTGMKLGSTRPMDEARLKEMADTVTELIKLNRDIWAFLPQLQAHLHGRPTASLPEGDGTSSPQTSE
jgi:hypothetical protein